MKKILAVVAILCVACALGFSQEGSKVQVFGGYQFTSFSTAGLTDRQITHGWNSDVAVKISNHFAIVGDVSQSYKNLGSLSSAPIITPNYYAATRVNASAVSVTPYPSVSTFEPKMRYTTFAFGPRFMLPKGKFTPFGQVTIGFDHLALSANDMAGLSIAKNGFGMSVGGGLDINVNRHFSARLFKMEYKLQHLAFQSDMLAMDTAENLSHYRFATGVIYKF